MRGRVLVWGALWLAVAFAGPGQGQRAVAASPAIVDDARLAKAAEEPQNWRAHGGAHPDEKKKKGERKVNLH